MKAEQDGALIRPIAHIETDLPEKFGVPRQSGLCALKGRIVFMPEYRRAEALRGLEGFSHIWLIWRFSRAVQEGWRPTVRPPRLGGNMRVGVFASRSPFRPNSLALSCVRLVGIDHGAKDGPVLLVSGVDMISGTPIYDIKPYIPFADAHPEAIGGYTAKTREHRLTVDFPPELAARLPKEKLAPLLEILAGDPRPGYEEDADKIYGLTYAGYEIGFCAADGHLRVLRVEEVSLRE